MSTAIAIAALIAAGLALALAIAAIFRVNALMEERIDQMMRDRDLF